MAIDRCSPFQNSVFSRSDRHSGSSVHLNIQAIQLVALTWGIWHGMMQTYGFRRIYDAKSVCGGHCAGAGRLALCFAWFFWARWFVPAPLPHMSRLVLFERWSDVPIVLIATLRNIAWLALGVGYCLFFLAPKSPGPSRITPLFHDVQYLAIVWIYNRTRVERDETFEASCVSFSGGAVL